MFVSDLRHFLDLPEDVPGPARLMALRLSSIVRAATAGDAGVRWTSALRCERRPGRQRCTGHIAVLRTDIPASIAWLCTSCDDEGVISGWERSPYDLRGPTPGGTPSAARRIVIPADATATLRELHLWESEAERLVFRARPCDGGVEFAGDVDAFDELVDCLTAETNNEDNRRRQRRLDDAYLVLVRAVEASQGC